MHNLLVVGGNGFIGSAVCKAALSRGINVTSISSSGRPFATPKGHSSVWTSKVNWVAADALQPESYSHLLPGMTAVVHTLGTLFEDTGYKEALRNGDIAGLLNSATKSVSGGRVGGSNPLRGKEGGTYERLNRDAALQVCEAFAASSTNSSSSPKAFVYLSAEDIFRPFIPARYIETKRQAEKGISDLLRDRPDIRRAFVRPSLVYHSHFRPLTTPLATLLDFSATLHRAVPAGIPTPSGVLRQLSNSFPPVSSNADPATSIPSPLTSIANAMVIPPIHVDHVAEAVCKVIEDESVEGVVDVSRMRELIGWSLKGQGELGGESN